MDNSKLVIIGGGNVGMAIAQGINQAKISERITITRKSSTFSEEEINTFNCLSDNKIAVSISNVVIIAVQPSQVDELLSEIKEVLTDEHILISVVSGLQIEQIETVVGNIPIARAMPNIAIKVKQSMTCLTFNEEGEKHHVLVKSIFDSVGLTLVIAESKFPEATGLCGSGTAFALKFNRVFMQAGIQHGFNEKDALMIASQVAKGASMLIQDGWKHPEVEIDKVTTPGGCTSEGLKGMEHAGFGSALFKGIEVCIKRARQLYGKKKK